MKKMLMVTGTTLALATPLAALALGQLTSPIDVQNARRGQVIEERLILNNSDDRSLELALAGQGDIAGWATFFLPGDRGTPVASVTVGAKSNLEAWVKLTVPDDTRNGTYRGTIQVSQAAASTTAPQVGAMVALSTSRQVTITVTDKEEIAFTAQVIPVAFDVRPGDPLGIKLLYRNQGNVQIKPQARVVVKQDAEVSGQAAKVMGETIFPYPADTAPVKPREEGTVTVQWPTYGLAEGKYFAEVTASEGGVEQSDDFAFSVSAKAPAPGERAGASGGGLNPALLAGVIVAIAIVAAAAMRRRR